VPIAKALPTNDEIARFGTPEIILNNVRENFAQTRDGIRDHLSVREAEQIEAAQMTFVENHHDLFAERIAAGRVRDVHGDLRLEHVYFAGDGAPTIIDCIEFNERFRYADVCSDVAFLSMDFTRLGRADLAEQFLAAYARASNDYDLYRLVDFYEAYRAYVRGKVASILAADAGANLSTRELACIAARRAYLLALREGRDSLLPPAVVAVGGIIASGKSTIADRIAVMMGAPVVDADRTRKSLLGVPATTPLDGAAWSGAYGADVTDRVYAEVLRRADSVLASKRPVILDASFRSEALRGTARAFARERGVPFYFVECRVGRDEALRRLSRRAEGSSVSDGRVDIFDDFVAKWEPIAELPRARMPSSVPPFRRGHWASIASPTWKLTHRSVANGRRGRGSDRSPRCAGSASGARTPCRPVPRSP
jgi:predicted kinase